MSTFLQAARHTDPKNPLPHQDAAWQWAWEQFTAEERQQFLEMFRAAVPSKQDTAANTWAGVTAAAQAAGARFPELVAAQWALESAWGQKPSGKHNYFGLKGSGTAKPTQEFVNGQWISITDQFIDFQDLRTSVQYLVNRWYRDFNANGKTYKGVNNAKDRNAAAQLLVSEGYATDPTYATKLIKLMDQHAPKAPAIQQEPAKLTPSSPFTARLTPHIQLGEFALFQEARRFQAQHQVNTAAELAAFMERCRRQFGGKPVVITSGYRPAAINRSVGGASGSEHLYDSPGVGAVDFYIKDTSIKAVQDWCDKNWPYSLGYGAPKGFVHLGIRKGKPRVRWDY